MNLINSLSIYEKAFFRELIYLQDEININIAKLYFENNYNFLNLFFLVFISPDLVFAKVFKELIKRAYSQIDKENELLDGDNSFINLNNQTFYQIKNQRDKLRIFVILSNRINLCLSLLIFSILLVISMLFEGNVFYESIWYLNIIIILIFRITSRVYEVVTSFYLDTVHTKVQYFYSNKNLKILEKDKNMKINSNRFYVHWKSTSLRKPERISLAVYSYIEMIIWFAILYYLFSLTPGCHESWINSAKTLYDSLLYSCSINFFNISYDPSFEMYIRFAHVTQVFTSIILVVLSLATYLGDSDEMDEEEVYDFLNGYYFNEEDKLNIINEHGNENIL